MVRRTIILEDLSVSGYQVGGIRYAVSICMKQKRFSREWPSFMQFAPFCKKSSQIYLLISNEVSYFISCDLEKHFSEQIHVFFWLYLICLFFFLLRSSNWWPFFIVFGWIRSKKFFYWKIYFEMKNIKDWMPTRSWMPSLSCVEIMKIDAFYHNLSILTLFIFLKFEHSLGNLVENPK